MNSVQRSILLSAADRYGNLVLFVVATAVLSRLLSPSEFGVYAVVNAIALVIAASFQEFGGGNYLIQKRDLSAEDIRSAFTITFIISGAIVLLLFIFADSLALLFAQDSLKEAIEVSALNFLLLPISGTISALLRRDMRFGTVATCNLVSGVATALVSIGLAIAGLSYMAPVWGGLAGSVILALALLAAPSRPKRAAPFACRLPRRRQLRALFQRGQRHQCLLQFGAPTIFGQNPRLCFRRSVQPCDQFDTGF
ncbi:O-antigen/teichoic acid export membrane protein [Bradyrhizobium liaoningense]